MYVKHKVECTVGGFVEGGGGGKAHLQKGRQDVDAVQYMYTVARTVHVVRHDVWTPRSFTVIIK